MREWISAKVREWLILGIGLVVIGGGLYAAALIQGRSNSINAALVEEGHQIAVPATQVPWITKLPGTSEQAASYRPTAATKPPLPSDSAAASVTKETLSQPNRGSQPGVSADCRADDRVTCCGAACWHIFSVEAASEAAPLVVVDWLLRNSRPRTTSRLRWRTSVSS
jgi:hypothetical protein